MAVREAEPLKLRTAPLIFLSTVLTHLVGGSAGREGAALQLGGSLAAWVGKKIRLDAKDHRIMIMCGMSAAFSALFGTPLTAALFSMEVVSVGVLYYAALVPCLTSAMVAFQLACLCGLHQVDSYPIHEVLALTPTSMVKVMILGVCIHFILCFSTYCPKIISKTDSSAPVARLCWGMSCAAGHLPHWFSGLQRSW